MGPDTVYGIRRLTWVRAGAALLTLAVALAWSADSLVGLAPLLWPPTEPLTRWVTLVFVVALSLLVPVLVGSLVADAAYRRYRD
jgi:hypothetical protein